MKLCHACDYKQQAEFLRILVVAGPELRGASWMDGTRHGACVYGLPTTGHFRSSGVDLESTSSEKCAWIIDRGQ